MNNITFHETEVKKYHSSEDPTAWTSERLSEWFPQRTYIAFEFISFIPRCAPEWIPDVTEALL